MEGKDPFKLFRVKRNDSMAKKQKAFDRLKLDAQTGSCQEEVSATLKFITQAFDMMTDPDLIAAYDRGGWEEVARKNQKLGGDVSSTASSSGGNDDGSVQKATDKSDMPGGSKENPNILEIVPVSATLVLVNAEDDAGPQESSTVRDEKSLNELSQPPMTSRMHMATQTEGAASDYYNGRRLQELEEEVKKLRGDLKSEVRKRERVEEALEVEKKRVKEEGQPLTAKKRRLVIEDDDDDEDGEDDQVQVAHKMPAVAVGGKKIHKCELCGKTFCRSTVLNRHIEEVHKDSRKECPKCKGKFRRLEDHKCNPKIQENANSDPE